MKPVSCKGNTNGKMLDLHTLRLLNFIQPNSVSATTTLPKAIYEDFPRMFPVLHKRRHTLSNIIQNTVSSTFYPASQSTNWTANMLTCTEINFKFVISFSLQNKE